MLLLAEPRPTQDGGASARAVAARWARAEALGARRDSDAYPVGPGGPELLERRARMVDLLREEQAEVDGLARQLATRAFCALVADADGVVLSTHAGDGFALPAARARLIAGADWSEPARGTNAIGTAIAERTSVAVIGGAHFERRNGALFCYAAPVFDATGALAAVVDVSGALPDDDPSLAGRVADAAATIERALREMALAQAGFANVGLLHRLIERSSGPAFLVEPRGAVRVHNDAARRALRGRIDCEAIFGVAFGALADMARGGGDLRFETRDGVFRVHLDPLLDPRQAALGVVVHLERVEARTAPPPPSPGPAPALPPAFDAIYAEDPTVLAAKALAATFAATPLPVLLLAETGSGKELFARAIHASSAVAAGPFVAVNCGALSHALLESELFGYAPGAFTGAGRGGSLGLIGAADGGTLFLDEIAEMPEALQAALLRALDDGSYRRLGDSKPRRSAFRLVSATCRDLAACVEAGTFRRDLFFRIHGACVRVPPVRERSDRVGLASALLAAARTSPPPLAPSAVRHVETHTWPGNVRELKSAVEHALVLGGAGPLEREHFPAVLLGAPSSARTRDAILRQAADEALEAAGGNVSLAARRLGVARDTLYKMLRRG